jgi:hypothetical protein
MACKRDTFTFYLYKIWYAYLLLWNSLSPWPLLRIRSIATYIFVFLFLPLCKLNDERPGMNPGCFLISVYQAQCSRRNEIRFRLARAPLHVREALTLLLFHLSIFRANSCRDSVPTRPRMFQFTIARHSIFDVVWSEQLKAYLNKPLTRS